MYLTAAMREKFPVSRRDVEKLETLLRQSQSDPDSKLSVFKFKSASLDSAGNRNLSADGKSYDVWIYLLMDVTTGDSLDLFIREKDKSIILDMYKELFPKSYDVNRIQLPSSW